MRHMCTVKNIFIPYERNKSVLAEKIRSRISLELNMSLINKWQNVKTLFKFNSSTSYKK